MRDFCVGFSCLSICNDAMMTNLPNLFDGRVGFRVFPIVLI